MPWMGLVAITGIERRVSRGDETNCRCKENHPSPCHWRIFQGAHPSDYKTTVLLTASPALLQHKVNCLQFFNANNQHLFYIMSFILCILTLF